jgi:beta-glucosidase
VQAGLDVVMPNAGFLWSELIYCIDLERLEGMTARFLLAHYFLSQDEISPENGPHLYNVEHPIIDVREDHSALI